MTGAAESGLPTLLRDAETGADVIVERHGSAVADVVSMRRLGEIQGSSTVVPAVLPRWGRSGACW